MGGLTPAKPEAPRCVWVEVSVSRQVPTTALTHTLLDVWSWANKKALQVAVW